MTDDVRRIPDPIAGFDKLTLERKEVATGAAIGRQLIEDLSVHATEDWMRNNLFVSMRTFLLARKVMEDRVPVHFDAEAEVVNDRAPKVAATAALVLAGLALGGTLASAWWVSIPAAVWAVAFLILRAAEMKQTQKVPVAGAVVVRAEYLQTFPENDIVFPSAMGTPYPRIEVAHEWSMADPPKKSRPDDPLEAGIDEALQRWTKLPVPGSPLAAYMAEYLRKHEVVS